MAPPGSPGEQAASANATRMLLTCARYPPSTPTASVATLIDAHCTDWNTPVSPRGLPVSTMMASASTSQKASPNPIAV